MCPNYHHPLTTASTLVVLDTWHVPAGITPFVNSRPATEDSRVNAFFSSLLSGLAAIMAAVSLVWLLSLVKRDVSIVDIFWGLGFVGLSWFYRALGPEITSRHWLLLALVTIWGFRLALYLLWRNWGHDEDPRYQTMRAISRQQVSGG